MLLVFVICNYVQTEWRYYFALLYKPFIIAISVTVGCILTDCILTNVYKHVQIRTYKGVSFLNNMRASQNIDNTTVFICKNDNAWSILNYFDELTLLLIHSVFKSRF